MNGSNQRVTCGRKKNHDNHHTVTASMNSYFDFPLRVQDGLVSIVCSDQVFDIRCSDHGVEAARVALREISKISYRPPAWDLLGEDPSKFKMTSKKP